MKMVKYLRNIFCKSSKLNKLDIGIFSIEERFLKEWLNIVKQENSQKTYEKQSMVYTYRRIVIIKKHEQNVDIKINYNLFIRNEMIYTMENSIKHCVY